MGLGLPDEASATAAALSGVSSHDGVNDHLRRELAARGGESTTLRLTGEAAASVDAYVEYRRIVGDADGGVLFSGALCVCATRRATAAYALQAGQRALRRGAVRCWFSERQAAHGACESSRLSCS